MLTLEHSALPCVYLFGNSDGVNRELRDVSTGEGSERDSTYRMIEHNLTVNVRQ